MAIKRYLQRIAIVVCILLFTALQAMAAPDLTGQNNSKTNNDSTSFTVNVSESVHFSATSNETINMTWHWFLNGTDKNNNLPSYDVSFSGDSIVEVNVTNQSSGLTSNTLKWIVTIQTSPPPSPPKPYIESWGNTKTNNDSINIVINRSESITFNATANQTVTWNWYVNGIKNSYTSDNFNYQFNTAGTQYVSVNVTNQSSGLTSNNIVNWTIEVVDAVPPSNITALSNTNGITWIKWTWTNPTDIDFSYVMIYLNNIWITNTTSKTTNEYNNSSLVPKTSYNISLKPVDLSGNLGNWTNNSASTSAQTPNIILKSPSDLVFETEGIQTKTFVIQMGAQSANVTWMGAKSQTNLTISPDGLVDLTFTPTSKGSYNISVSANNENGTSNMISWNWTVRPTTYSTGNRIWDGSKPLEFSKTYTWTAQSFSGFYYNAKDDVGSESLKMTLGSYTSRTITKGNLDYSTSPQEVSFTHTGWGKYQVIGFMADKYFAGYTGNTSSLNTRPTTNFAGISSLSGGNLHRVLIDDDTKRTISVGGTLALQDGYVLKATDIDLNARTMLLSLLKDGNEVDVSPLSAGETYVYTKTVGGTNSLPLILVRFENVFSGQELQVAFMKGLFQISEAATKVNNDDRFGNMEISSVSQNGIEMTNSANIGLNKGATVDLMGNLKIKVADNDAVRFALTVDNPPNQEVRSTVYKDTNPVLEWTPYNFGINIGDKSLGFYYNLDEGVGSEKLRLKNTVSGRTIPDEGLEYSTSPQEVPFTYTGFGKYQAIGFMADNYFAGYTSNTGYSNGKRIATRPTTDFAGLSTIANGNLLKVLMDDDTKRTISVGGTIALQEGYVLKATDIDLNGRMMLISLLKDGNEVDVSPLSAGETYVYTKTIGGTESLPLIMVRFESVFSGQELQVAFLKGIFQISEKPTKVTVGDQFGKMEVTSVQSNEITMSNSGSIGLSRNANNALMGNIRLKVADTDAALRFYFAVDITPEMIANQLVIDAPSKAMAGDTIRIMVTAGGAGKDGAIININNQTGTTDSKGVFNYTLPKDIKGTYSITATLTGYEKASKNIEIEKYVDYRLSIDAPSQSNQFETITIKVLYNGTAMSGAKVLFDNTTIGTSDSNGEVTYKLESSGTHSITASKISYISVTRDIDIRPPYSEFKALDINITPNPGYAGEEYVVISNITNVGTKSDSTEVELIVNGTVVDNKTVTLGPNEKIEVNFTRTEEIAGNVTVEILGQSMLFEARENPTNYLLIGAIVTGIGAVIIYTLTSKGMLSVEILKEKSMLLKQAANSQVQKLSMLLKK